MNIVPKSRLLSGLEWLGPRVPDVGTYKADTFPITWADDDLQYTSGGDPLLKKNPADYGLDVVSIDGNPSDYQITPINEMPGFTGGGGHGPKPTGMLCRAGVLYLFAQNMGHWSHENKEKCHGYDAQIFQSHDKGKTWEPPIESIRKSPMFPGRDFGSPCFINYGKDHAGATDDFVYAVSGQGWANGNTLTVGRVPATRIMDRAAWEFVGGFDAAGTPVWLKDVKAAVPVLEDPGFLGCADCVYIASLKRYLLLDWRFKVERADAYSCDDGSELAIYEAPQPWGPYSVVTKIDWETPEVTPYNPRLPLKWFDGDNLEGYLLFSGTWRGGGTSEFYRIQLRRFKLQRVNGGPL